MGRTGLRILMVATGLGLTTLYVGGAYLSYRVLVWVLADRVSLAVTAFALVGMTFAFGVFSYRFGTLRLLSRVGARAVPPERAPDLYGRVEHLSDRMNLAPPTIAVASLDVPNAFALGGVGDGVVVIDRRLFALLDEAELEALLAHELAHLEGNDALIQTLAYSAVRTLVGLLTLLVLPVVLLVTGVAQGGAWIAGRPTEWQRSPLWAVFTAVETGTATLLVVLTLLIRAHSRRREFAADDRAVTVTGTPIALARALRKIETASNPERHLVTTLYVHGDEGDRLGRLLSTHPSMDERVDRLVERSAEDRPGPTPIEVR